MIEKMSEYYFNDRFTYEYYQKKVKIVSNKPKKPNKMSNIIFFE